MKISASKDGLKISMKGKGYNVNFKDPLPELVDKLLNIKDTEEDNGPEQDRSPS